MASKRRSVVNSALPDAAPTENIPVLCPACAVTAVHQRGTVWKCQKCRKELTAPAPVDFITAYVPCRINWVSAHPLDFLSRSVSVPIGQWCEADDAHIVEHKRGQPGIELFRIPAAINSSVAWFVAEAQGITSVVEDGVFRVFARRVRLLRRTEPVYITDARKTVTGDIRRKAGRPVKKLGRRIR